MLVHTLSVDSATIQDHGRGCCARPRAVRLMAWIFLIIGASGMVGCAISHGCFSILGEAMTQRLRVAILTSIFRQEWPGWRWAWGLGLCQL